MAAAKKGRLKILLGAVVALAIITAAAYLGWQYMVRSESNPMSDDTVLQANLVNVSSTVPGRIVELNVAENSRVRRGDLLFSIDPVPYQLAVDQARADLEMAKAALSTQERTIVAETSNDEVAAEQAARARTNLELATQTLDRLTALRPKGYVTAQQVDDAATAKRDAEISLRQAVAQAAAANALVSTTEGAEALVKARQAALALAERNLEDTRIRAPHDGLIVGLTIATGEFVVSGQSVFTLIDTDHWYASAAFVETELRQIGVGDCATVYALADRSVPIRGRVEGIGWGVISEEVVSVPRNLPYVPKSLNWVRVAQRFPVRIVLEDPPQNLMRVGASALAIVHRDQRC